MCWSAAWRSRAGSRAARGCRRTAGRGAGHPDLAAGLLIGGTVTGHGGVRQAGEGDAVGSSAADDRFLVLQGDAGDPRGGVHGGQHRRAGALQLVAEHAVPAVGVHDFPRIARVEAPEMEQCAGEQRGHRLDVPVDERVVVRAAAPARRLPRQNGSLRNASLSVPVSSHTGITRPGWSTSRGGVESRLPRSGAGAAIPPDTGYRDLPGVAAHDDVNITGAQPESGERLLDIAGPVDRQVDAARVGELVPADRLLEAARPSTSGRSSAR